MIQVKFSGNKQIGKSQKSRRRRPPKMTSNSGDDQRGLDIDTTKKYCTDSPKQKLNKKKIENM